MDQGHGENETPELSIHFAAWERNNTIYAQYSVDYRPKNLKKGEKDDAKNYVTTKSNEIAEICNITLDWSLAKWQIFYRH